MSTMKIAIEKNEQKSIDIFESNQFSSISSPPKQPGMASERVEHPTRWGYVFVYYLISLHPHYVVSKSNL